MADVLTKEQRRLNMSRVRDKDSHPEKYIRTMIHRLGYRFRLHRRDLPGKPDLVFPSRRKVIFVHGCFWHVHNCSKGRSEPKTNSEFWLAKRQSNVERDMRNIHSLEEMGWKALIVWECQIKKLPHLDQIIKHFLEQ